MTASEGILQKKERERSWKDLTRVQKAILIALYQAGPAGLTYTELTRRIDQQRLLDVSYEELEEIRKATAAMGSPIEKLEKK